MQRETVVILTRDREANSRTESLLAANGFPTRSLTLLRYDDIQISAADRQRLQDSHDVLLSSARAADRYRSLIGDGRGRAPARAFTIGDRSARILRTMIPNDRIRTVSRSSEALEMLADDPVMRNATLPLLYPCSRKRALDVAALARRSGRDVREIPLYEPVPMDPTLSEWQAVGTVGQHRVIVLLFSPSAVRSVIEQRDRLDSLAPKAEWLAIGETTGTAAVQAGLEPLHISETPNLDGIIRTLHQLS